MHTPLVPRYYPSEAQVLETLDDIAMSTLRQCLGARMRLQS